MHTAVSPATQPAPAARASMWWPIALGALVLVVPTCIRLASGAWELEENGHGPLVLAVVLWLFWRARGALAQLPDRPAIAAGSTALLLGLFVYVIGRSQSVILAEVAALIPVTAGAALVLFGWRGLRVLWFPIAFLVFLVPLPGLLVTALTAPLKHGISSLVEHFLYALGFPIGRTGVVLTVGPYELLVADACSGLNSIYSLSALGLLYLHLMRYASRTRMLALLAAILPIAFAANVVRVLTLVLITYYLGDGAGQGFLHGFSGLLLFFVSLALLFGIDRMLDAVGVPRTRRPA